MNPEDQYFRIIRAQSKIYDWEPYTISLAPRFKLVFGQMLSKLDKIMIQLLQKIT